ncbi:MAG: hypothetical protein IKB38_04490 [Clostridia bacterium]|nr:hypothetical protein [Clostridia bacterium]
MKIKLNTVMSGFSEGKCKVHARVGATADGGFVMTYQMLATDGCDYFETPRVRVINNDNFASFTDAPEHTPVGFDIESGVFANTVPALHKPSGKLLLLGDNVNYLPGTKRPDKSRPKGTYYSVFDEQNKTYLPLRPLRYEDGAPLAGNFAASCSDRCDLPDGRIFVPTYGWQPSGKLEVKIYECRFAGDVLFATGRESESIKKEDSKRGVGEPSLTYTDGQYFITLRTDEQAMFSVSDDPLNFSKIAPVRWDTGECVPSYNTQTKWLRLGGRLYLVYTRKAENNSHVFRHRAPLWIAEFDTGRHVLIKDTEMALTPNRGARCGNFGVAELSDTRALVTVAEWMQPVGCEKYGSDNSVFIADISV